MLPPKIHSCNNNIGRTINNVTYGTILKLSTYSRRSLQATNHQYLFIEYPENIHYLLVFVLVPHWKNIKFVLWCDLMQFAIKTETYKWFSLLFPDFYKLKCGIFATSLHLSGAIRWSACIKYSPEIIIPQGEVESLDVEYHNLIMKKRAKIVSVNISIIPITNRNIIQIVLWLCNSC